MSLLGFEECRPALLLGIIVRDKRKRPSVEVSNLPTVTPKKLKLDNLPIASPTTLSTPLLPTRSYTPPPMKDVRMKLPPLPPIVPTLTKDDDGMYCILYFTYYFKRPTIS